MAAYFGIDPMLMRIGIIALAMAGVGVVGYLIAWVILPEAPEGYVPAPADDTANSGRFVVDVVMVAVGVLLMVDWLLPIRQIFWPVTLIAVGATIAVYGVRR